MRLFIFLTLCLILSTFQSVLAKNMPSVKRNVLPNGLTVVTLEERSNPLVVISGRIFAGEIYEGELKGISSALAYMIKRGTTSKSFLEISEILDNLGARLNFVSTKETIDISSNFLSKDTKTVLNLLSDILKNPSFPEGELLRYKKIAETKLNQIKDDPESLANLKFYQTIYPKGHLLSSVDIEEQKENLKKINREMLEEFFRKYIGGERTILVIVGDFNTDEVLALLRENLSTWSCEEKISKIDIKGITNLVPKRENIIMPDKVQVYCMIGYHQEIKREDKDFYTARLLGLILADLPLTSRLYKRLREEEGLVYFVDSDFFARKIAGPFYISFGTKKENVDKAIDIVISEVKKLRDKGVSSDELNLAASYITGAFPLTLDSNSRIATVLLSAEYFNLGLDFPWNFKKHYKNISLEDINSLAKNYLKPENFTIICAGP